MAFDVGAIVATMTLDNKKWNAAMENVKKKQGKFAKAIEKNSQQIKSMGKAFTIAGTAIVGIFGLMVNKTVQLGDEIDKMSRRTGIGAKSLSELFLAAELSGASITDVERAIKRMSGTILDASEGLETYVRSFRQLGLSVDDIMKLSPEQQFLQISEAIASLEHPTLRAALAQDIFGRSGTALLPMFDQGIKGLREMRDLAHKTGIVFDKETATASAFLKDRLTELNASFKGIVIGIGNALMPMITDLTIKLSGIIQGIGKWIRENRELVSALAPLVLGVGGLLAVAGPLLFMLPQMVKGFQMVKVAILATNPVILGIAAATAVVTIGLKIWIAAMDKAMRKMQEAATAEKSAIYSVRKFREQADKEEQEFINRSIKRFKAQGIGHGEAMILIRNQLIATSAAFREFEHKNSEAGKKEIKERKENAEVVKRILEGIRDKTAELTLSEFDLRRRELRKWFNEQSDILKESGAKEASFVELRKAFSLEMKQIKSDETKFIEEENEKRLESERQINEKIQAINKASIDQSKENAEVVLETFREMQNEKELIGLEGFQRDMELLMQEKDAELLSLQERLGNTIWFEMARENITKKYVAKKAEIERKYREEIEKGNKITFAMITQIAAQAINRISAIFRMASQNRMAQLDKEYEARKQEIEENITDETEREKALEALEEEFGQKKAEINLKTAKQEKAVALMGAIVSTAQAVAKALTAGPILGPIFAGIIGALGAVQINLIRRQPLPEAQEGAFVKREGPVIAHPGEVILDENRIREVLEGGVGGAGSPINFYISTLDATDFTEVIHKKVIPVLQDAAKDENFLIQRNAVKEFV